MQKEMIDGDTSFTLPKTIAKMMEKEGVSDKWKLVTKYYSVRHPQLSNTKYIYLAYDSESTTAFHKGYIEFEHFEDVWQPDLIVVFGKASQKYYKKHGYETHLLNLGYDDLHYKKYGNMKKKWDITFIGTFDPIRWSDFYLRYFIGESLSKFKGFNGFFANDVKYKDIGKVYSQSLTAYNDVIRLSPNMRMFEIPSNGCMMLVNDIVHEFIHKYNYPLEMGKHYKVFKDFPELVQHIKYAVENKDETMALAQEAKELILQRPLSKEVAAMCSEYNLCED